MDNNLPLGGKRMNRFTKISLALASTGGALMFTATPMAFASVSGSVAVSGQYQNGSSSNGVVMDQNSSLSAGGVSADHYYNNNVDNGYTQTTTTYNNGSTANQPTTSVTTQNYGGSDWTKANNFSSQGATASLNQSQIIGNANGANGGTQVGVAGAVSGAAACDGISGGAAGTLQVQNGNNAYGATLAQSSGVQAGLTSAEDYQYSTYSGGSTVTANQWDNGVLTTSTTTTNAAGSKSYTWADDYLNPYAGASYDQNQNIQSRGQGGTQFTGSAAVAGHIQWW
jgi:hypothetical protein